MSCWIVFCQALDSKSRLTTMCFASTKKAGTGLGLSISHSLIKRYGGNITVDSVLGQGSEFVVRLLAEPIYSGDGQH